MPDENQSIVEQKAMPPTVTKEEKLNVLFEKIAGSDFNLNDTQIDSIIDERRQVHKYIHDERMQKHERFKLLHKERKFIFS